MLRAAVVDNDCLINLCHLHNDSPFFHYLTNIFGILYFPQAVMQEYQMGASKEPHRERMVEKIKPEAKFWRFCTTYDSIVMAMVQGQDGIDKGEAESYAQYKRTNAHFILSDDKKFTIAIKKIDSRAKVYTTLHILSWLQLANFLPDWEKRVLQLCQIRPFGSSTLREAYVDIIKELGLDIHKKQINRMCSLSKFR